MSTPANALDITQAGLVKFNGSTTFSGVTTTNHSVLVGAASNGITNVGPSATTGAVLKSGGASADPGFSSSFTLSSSDVMTNTAQPMVSAYVHTAMLNSTGDGTDVQVVFDNISFQQGGSNLNTSTGDYTIPADGKYLIIGQVEFVFATVANNSAYIQINAGGAVRGKTVINPSAIQDGGSFTMSVNQIIVLSAGDVVSIHAFLNGGAKTSGIGGDYFAEYSYLSIAKIS